MTKMKKVPDVIIGDGTNSTATTIGTINKGDLFLSKSDGTLITTTAAAQALKSTDEVMIVGSYKNGKTLMSMPFKGTDVRSYLGNKYDAPIQQITYVGFNGTSGTLPTTINTTYNMRVVFKGASVLSTRIYPRTDSTIITGASSVTEEGVAYKLIDAFVNDMSEGSKYIYAERITDATKGTVATGTTSFTFTEGSKVVTCAGDIDDATGGTALAVGAYLVIGVAGDTDATYKIASIDTTNNILTLDTVFAQATTTLEDTELKQISAANAAAGTWGIKLTGKEIPDLLDDYDQYKMTLFEVSMYTPGSIGTDDTVAIITNTIKPSPGNGYYRQVRIDEREAQTFRGWHSKTMYYHSKPDTLTDSSVGYDSITVEYVRTLQGDFFTDAVNPLVCKVYIPTGTAQSDEDTANSFASIMNGYFSTVLGFTAINLDV